MINVINKTKNQGFVLLFSVILSAIILAIALGVSNITYRELTFSTSAERTNAAFYAADTGAECALYYDLTLVPTLNPGGSATQYVFGVPTEFVDTECNGVDIALNEDEEGNITTTGPWVFNLTSLGANGRACALVTVTKESNDTTIVSRGYNVGYLPNEDDTPNCDSNDPGQVERVIEIRY